MQAQAAELETMKVDLQTALQSSAALALATAESADLKR